MRGESYKAVCAFLMIFSVPVGILAWYTDRPGAVAWSFRIGSIVVCVLFGGLLFRAMARRDKATDHLRALVGNYFNRDGFCFAFVPIQTNEGTFMKVLYQNQFEKPCRAVVTLRAARGFWLRRPDIQDVRAMIDCEGGGFGSELTDFEVPRRYQGKRRSFEAGATVVYPDGRGRRLRFFDGIHLRKDAHFQSRREQAFRIFLALSGAYMIGPKVKLVLPVERLATSNDNLASVPKHPG